ncbi:MAG TPA: peroxide stress protein YaaA [Bacteroidales bacterium]|nr:peroxide stress protein YaaA [Bacteroidales bacterium]
MLIILSPAKKLDYKSEVPVSDYTKPQFTKQSIQLIESLQNLSQEEVGNLMNLSDNLARLNKERFMEWDIPQNPDENTRQAVFAFKGDVYQGWNPAERSEDSLKFAQNHVRILSGLYGVLRPLDLMKPYRLEMGTRFGVNSAKNLYEFWSDIITDNLNKQLKEIDSSVLLNLASNEYAKAVNPDKLNAKIISPEFKDYKNGKYKIVSFYAKKARGLMTQFITDNHITDPEQIKLFDKEGYYYNDKLSEPGKPVFTRG